MAWDLSEDWRPCRQLLQNGFTKQQLCQFVVRGRLATTLCGSSAYHTRSTGALDYARSALARPAARFSSSEAVSPATL